LRAAIERYKAENPDTAFWRDFSAARCSWESVLGELDEAKQIYMEKGTRIPLRRGLRHGSGIARNLKPLLEGIPQDDGLGFIKGGFIIIFNVSTIRFLNELQAGKHQPIRVIHRT
jgi:hypothetical protein